MNCKNLHLILAFLALALNATSSPINRKVIRIGKCKATGSKATGSKTTENDVNNINEVCDTPECHETAERILSKIDEEVDPCNNFYDFACGNWMKTNEIPEDQTSIGGFDFIRINNINTLTEVLKGEYKPNKNLTEEQQKADEKTFNQLQNIFKTCLNTDAIDAKGNEPLIKLLNELNINNKEADYTKVKDLTDLLVKLHYYKVPILFDYDVSLDSNNPNINVLNIQQADLGLPNKEKYKDEEIVPVYKETIHDMLANVFSERSKEDIDRLAAAVYDLESKIASISLSASELEDAYHNPNEQKRFTINTIGDAYPYIDWKTLINDLLAKLNIKKEFNDDISIVDITSTYFEKLGDIIKNTDSETLATFAEWTFIKKYGKYVADEVKTPLKKLNKELTGVEDDGKRNEFCIDILDSYMGMATGRLFIENSFAGNSKEIAENIIDNIEEAMIKKIPNTVWLDEQTADYAVKKAQSIDKMVGYPDYLNDPIELAKDYEGLEINDEDFFTNVANSNSIKVGYNLKTVFEPGKLDKWQMTPQTVNAYYDPSRNQIVFSAGILQSPFFGSHNPAYINYGEFGAVAGHELTHGFDNNGRKYTIEGSFGNWWTDSTNEKFNELAQCFVDEYYSFSIEDKNGIKHYVNGTATLGENLADNGGIDRAYEAWKISIEKDGNAKENNKLLPGLNKYTQDQLFYIAFGQTWCSKQRPETAVENIDTDPHSPAIHRVNGVIYNSQRFAKIFNCPTNSPMNPEKKCSLW
ncbi:zincin [Anaeromyces robustus]|uniref:Zincin n=1 Tax=Anaeromyces robustus TaxID=1754192 RepID=A0A1Y1W4H3_9FUNG|nr:zincin [Anaeromyces robustus]|eukprot:ORX68074.1 zincin [Anaeromyces robustus]